jgi:AAA lid domain
LTSRPLLFQSQFRTVRDEDIRAVALPALRHRIILNFEGEAERVDPDSIIESILNDHRSGARMPRILCLQGGETVKTVVALIVCLHLGLSGCAMRGLGSANQRGERLAMERGRLSELTDPVAQTKSHVIISDILLSFAADAARDQDHEAFRRLLVEYGRAIETARDTIVHSVRKEDRRPQGYTDLEGALARQLRTLQSLKKDVRAEDHESLDQAIQIASTIHQQMLNLVSGAASRTSSS